MRANSVIYFGSDGRAYARPDGPAAAVGDDLSALTPAAPAGSRVVGVVRGLHPGGSVIAATAAGKVARISRDVLVDAEAFAGVAIVRLDPTFPDDRVVGVEAASFGATAGVVTHGARFANVPIHDLPAATATDRGVRAIRLDAKDRVVGLALFGPGRRSVTYEDARGRIAVLRATKYPIGDRGGEGYAVLQRGRIRRLVPGAVAAGT